MGRRQQGNAILFLPFAVFDEGRAETGRNQLLDLRDHSIALVANDKVGLFDSRVDQRIDRVTNQRATKHWDKRLQESSVGAA